ncbi:hypothetical protein GCM10017559_07840 [Streptosporangium longisporum]|uniref:Uncharacterized protein n=1 Tax=Streptosporangium longisporum TaxID=46187 RepID=A0ABN3XSJ1_9ACTN
MAEPTTVPASEVLDLLAAIRDALTVPSPAASAGRAREWLLVDRGTAVKAVIGNLVEGGRLSEECTASWWARRLRDLAAEFPADYPVAGGSPKKGERPGPTTTAGILRDAARIIQTQAPTVLGVAQTIRLAAGGDAAGRTRAEEALAFLLDHSAFQTLADLESWRERRTCPEVAEALELAAAAEQGGAR